MEKVCAACKECLDINLFSRNNQRKDGRQSYCKVCDNNYKKKWKKDNPEKSKILHRKYNRAYRDRNPELVSARVRDWKKRNYERNKEHNRKATSRYSKLNRDRRNAASRNYRGLKRSGGNGEPVDYQSILDKSNGICYLCNEEIDFEQPYHFDHIIPISKGGPHIEDNIAVTHPSCNLYKGATLLKLN